nr:MoaD/ThiS family protein [uncultured Flavonifractor sp.]
MALVRYYGRLAELTGCREEGLEGTSVSRLLDQIKKRHGAEALRLAKRSHIIVDSRSAGAGKGFRTPVGADSQVEFIPVCGGG